MKRLIAALLLYTFSVAAVPASAQKLELKKGDRICLVGNELG